jgi:hypothetical protein
VIILRQASLMSLEEPEMQPSSLTEMQDLTEQQKREKQEEEDLKLAM